MKPYRVVLYSLYDRGTKVVIAEVGSIKEGKAIMKKFRNGRNWNIERRENLDSFDHVILTVRTARELDLEAATDIPEVVK